MSTIINEKTERVSIDKLTPHPSNPRHGDLESVKESIEHNGFYGVIVAQRSSRHILAGNHRWRAARELGYDKVPVVWVDVDDEAALRILLADNRTSDLATYDEAELERLIGALLETDTGLAGTGYAGSEYDALRLTQNNDDDPLVEPEPSVPDVALKKWKVKTGDVWTAGNQIITCGDATDPAAYERIGATLHSIDMVWTDPPYGVAYEGGTGLTIENDDLDRDALANLLDKSFLNAFDATKPGGSWYVACPGGNLHHVFIEALLERDMLRQTIIWVKDQLFVLGRQDYHWRHEPILYGWKPGAAHYFAPGDRTQDTVWEMATLPEDTVWRIPRPKASAEHPTMKPVDLVARAIRNSTKPGQTVLDPFQGAGSMLLAAHQLDRHGRSIELDPKYVAVTLDRLEALGLEPTKA